MISKLINYLLKKLHPNKTAKCINHPKICATNLCTFCEAPLCESCQAEQDAMVFCRDHLPLYQKGNWIKHLSAQATAEKPEATLKLYELKLDLWQNQKIPAYLRTSYSTDSEMNPITTVELYIRESDRF